MTTDFRKQVEDALIHHRFGIRAYELDHLDEARRESPQVEIARSWLTLPETVLLVDAIVKLHDDEVERIRKDAASENRFAGMSDGGVQQLIKNAEYEIARRATIEPKKEGE
jgi:hypothetical protein